MPTARAVIIAKLYPLTKAKGLLFQFALCNNHKCKLNNKRQFITCLSNKYFTTFEKVSKCLFSSFLHRVAPFFSQPQKRRLQRTSSLVAKTGCPCDLSQAIIHPIGVSDSIGAVMDNVGCDNDSDSRSKENLCRN